MTFTVVPEDKEKEKKKSREVTKTICDDDGFNEVPGTRSADRNFCEMTYPDVIP